MNILMMLQMVIAKDDDRDLEDLNGDRRYRPLFTQESLLPRAEPIQGWPHTLREVTERMLDLQRGQRAFVLNPVVGVCTIHSYNLLCRL